MHIRWTPAAADDLHGIGEYLKEHNSSFAQTTVEKIYDAIQSLGRFPLRGRIGRQAGTRELVVSPLPYVIVYEVDDSTIKVSRILHGAQEWPGRKKSF